MPLLGLAMASAAPGDGVQNELLAISPCGHEPSGHGGFGTGSGSVSAVVVMSASMRERAVFIGLISVWDTIGTLPPSRVEIVMLFALSYCCVMGRKVPR